MEHLLGPRLELDSASVMDIGVKRRAWDCIPSFSYDRAYLGDKEDTGVGSIL